MKRFLMLVSVIVLTTSTPSFAAVDYFVDAGVTCTTVTGEHGFDILSFSVGGVDTVTASTAAGPGAGKPNLSSLVVAKQFDACSEPLIKQFLSASVIPTVRLAGLRVQGFVPILTITLTNARISNWQMSGSQESPTESVSFTYAQICIAYTPVSPSGAPGQPTSVCYDSARNRVS
jgi:type VI protein secretion system component Hcp